MLKRLIVTAFWLRVAKDAFEVGYKLLLDYNVKHGGAEQSSIDWWNEYVDEQVRRKHWQVDRFKSLKILGGPERDE